MNPKEIIEKLKQTFAELTTSAPAPVALMTATLKDGTQIEVTEMAVGGIVTINGQPAPMGEHELSDGTYIVVGDNGVITEIKPAMASEEPAAQEDMSQKFSEFMSSSSEKFSSYEQKFMEYETKFSEYENKLAKATQVIEGLISLTQSLAETPTGKADEVVVKENQFAEQKKKKNYDILFNK